MKGVAELESREPETFQIHLVILEQGLAQQNPF